MSTEALAIVGLTLIGLALPAMGAWFYQVFALKRELADLERRVSERIDRVEGDVRATNTTMHQVLRDLERTINRIEGRLDKQ